MRGAPPGGNRAVAKEALSRERLMHHSVAGPALMVEADERAPHWQARDEALGPVDRIERPDVLGVGAGGAEFPADDAMPGECRLNHPPQGNLRRAVRLRHRIEDAAARFIRRGHGRAEKRQNRLARNGGELIDELGEVDGRHHGSRKKAVENRAHGDGMSQSHRSGALAFCAVRAHIVAVRQLLPCMPSLGVSSLDLGRSFTGAASFFCGPRQALAASSRATSCWLSSSRRAPRSSLSCARHVALAIGAAISGLARSQARAICATVALWAPAISSRAARTRNPRLSRYLVAPAPRGLFFASSFDRYFPVRKPLAS